MKLNDNKWQLLPVYIWHIMTLKTKEKWLKKWKQLQLTPVGVNVTKCH